MWSEEGRRGVRPLPELQSPGRRRSLCGTVAGCALDSVARRRKPALRLEPRLCYSSLVPWCPLVLCVSARVMRDCNRRRPSHGAESRTSICREERIDRHTVLTQAFELLTETPNVSAAPTRRSPPSGRALRRACPQERGPGTEVAEVEALKNDLATVLESLTDGVVAVDTRGRVTAIKPGGRVHAGVNEVDAIGRPADEALARGRGPAQAPDTTSATPGPHERGGPGVAWPGTGPCRCPPRPW